ncbi:MAG: hypothetical protein GX118_04620 [Arcobacter butzleri]|nr:hypothetical protein [Aliarcobacter butzleri]
MNKLIVESHNDKIFIEKLKNLLDIDSLEIDKPLCNIDEFICLDGLGNLRKKLENEKLDKLNKLGILIDADEVGIEKRISEINDIFEKIGIEIKLKNINEFQKDTKNDIEIACHILNIDGNGSLDYILKTIAKEKSEYSDCLEYWKKCLEDKGKSISDTIFTKFWVNNYLRFDTCNKEEKKQISAKCSLEKALEKDIWNFEHKSLDSLKEFLKMF